jgi:probable addiction module antidote protein
MRLFRVFIRAQSEFLFRCYSDPFEDGHPELIGHTLGAVARSKGMTEIARRGGLGRQCLYKALSSEGRPEFATVLKVVRALGRELTVTGA